MLNTRRLGNRGLEVTALGIGLQGIDPATTGHAMGLLERALDLGCTFFDTTLAAHPSAVEEFLGENLKGRRRRLCIATQFGASPRRLGVVGVGNRPADIRRAVDSSLARLKTDYLDVLYQRSIEHPIPIEETAGVVGALIEEGKVLHFGLRNPDESTLRRAHAVRKVSVVQSEYSLWERGLERRILPALFDLGIGLVAVNPTGHRFFLDSSPEHEDCTAPAEDLHSSGRNLLIADVLREIAVTHGATSSQVALAWLMGVNQAIVPLAGIRRSRYLEENYRGMALRLAVEEVELLDEVTSIESLAGVWYNEAEATVSNF